MIADSKRRNALSAINAICILARAKAYEGKCDEVAHILDVAEYLPLLMLEPADQTETFRGHLVELALRYPPFEFALMRFDAPTV